jgi:hypothetical protein
MVLFLVGLRGRTRQLGRPLAICLADHGEHLRNVSNTAAEPISCASWPCTKLNNVALGDQGGQGSGGKELPTIRSQSAPSPRSRVRWVLGMICCPLEPWVTRLSPCWGSCAPDVLASTRREHAGENHVLARAARRKSGARCRDVGSWSTISACR